MAKVKSSGLRNYVGRLAGNVYYINKGQNIARELAPQVSNPQTESQMDQRIKLSNVVAMYRLNAGWMKDHAFPNRPQNQSIYNAFVAANLAGSEVALTKEDAARGYCVVAPYEITKGSLPRVQMLDSDSPDTAATSLKMTTAAIEEISTVGEFSAEIIENNPQLQEGDQISIITNFQYNDAAGIRALCRAFEITLDTLDTTPLEEHPTYAVLSTFSEVGRGTYFAVEMSDLAENAGSVYKGVAVIISRKTSSGIQVSPATLALYGDDRFYATMTSEARKRLARNSYGVSTEPFLVPGGGEGGETPVVDSNPITAINNVSAGSRLVLERENSLDIDFEENVTDLTGMRVRYGWAYEGSAGGIQETGEDIWEATAASLAEMVVGENNIDTSNINAGTIDRYGNSDVRILWVEVDCNGGTSRIEFA